MEWIKAVVHTTTEGVELVFGALLSCGINGAEIIDPSDLRMIISEETRQWDYIDESLLNHVDDINAHVAFYVTPDNAGHELLAKVKASLSVLTQNATDNILGSLDVSIEQADDETWLNEWKKYYRPFRVGKTVVIVPVWEKYMPEPGDIVFTIEPGSVFGTGLHQTTQLSIESLEEYVNPDSVLMDLGCGSGILSIISLLLGAKNVLACDFDPAAGIAVRDNTLLNPVNPDSVNFISGDIFDMDLTEYGSFDVVVANIVADVVIRLVPVVNKLLKKEGIFIASGIIDDRVSDVRSALAVNGYTVEKETERDGWYCLVSRCA